jgi:hypothetical protein
MIRIWAKVMVKDKIIKQTVYERSGNTDYSLFFDYVRDVCEILDVPTPVIIKTHIFNYAKYNYVRFTKADFVENIDFEKLVLENAFV